MLVFLLSYALKYAGTFQV